MTKTEIEEIVKEYFSTDGLYRDFLIDISTGEIWTKCYVGENDYTIYDNENICRISMNKYLHQNIRYHTDDTIKMMTEAIYNDLQNGLVMTL